MSVHTTPSSRKRRWAGVAAAVLALAITAAACGPAAPEAGQGGPPDAITATVYNRTNADRGAQGLGGLAWDGRLYSLAADWAGYMAANHVFHHRDLTAAINSPGFESYASLGENILVGPEGINGDQMENAWLASPSHLANIMGNYDSMGVALAYGDDGNVRAVVNFGRQF